MSAASEGGPRSASGTQAIDRALEILRFVAMQQCASIALSDLVEHLQVSRPTVHRIANRLEQEGFLYRDPATRQYFLGDFFANLSSGVGAHDRLRNLCAEPIRRLSAEVGDTVYLIVRVGDDGRCIVCNESASPVRIVTVTVGAQRPLGVGGGGLAILAALPPSEQDAIIKRNRIRYGLFSNVDERQLHGAVAAAIRQGYAVNDVHQALGVKTVSHVLHNAAGEPIAALSVSSLSQRIDGCLPRVLRPLKKAVVAIEAALADV